MKKTNTFIKEQTASSDPGLNKTVKSGCIYGFNNEANFISYDNSPQPTASHWLGRGMALAIAKDNYVSIDVKQTDRTCARGCVCIRCECACVCMYPSACVNASHVHLHDSLLVKPSTPIHALGSRLQYM